MKSQQALLGSVFVMMLALALFISTPGQAQDANEAQSNQPAVVDEPAAAAADDVEAKTLTGTIVGVHEYLVTGKTDAEGGDKDLLSFFASEAPIALRVDETTLAKKLVPGGTTYLIMFDPSESSGRDVYAQARKLIGKPVAVTGQLFEKDGLRAISILGVHTIPDQAAAETGHDGQM